MKKILIGFAFIIVLILVLIFSLFIVYKTQFNQEKITEKLIEMSRKAGYTLMMKDAEYNVSLFSVKSNITGFSLESKYFILTAERIELILNPIKLLKKEIYLEKINLIKPYLKILKTEKSDTIKSSESGNILLTTNLIMKEGTVEYDTMILNNINGKIFIDKKNNLRFGGNVKINSNLKNISFMDTIAVSFTGVYDSIFNINKFNLSNRYVDIEGSVKMKDSLFSYNAAGEIKDIKMLKHFSGKIDTLNMNGSSKFVLSGNYNRKAEMKSQLLEIVKEIQIFPVNIEIEYDKHRIVLNDGLYINRQYDNLVLSGKIFIDSTNTDLISIVNMKELLEDTVLLDISMKGFQSRLIPDIIKNDKIKLDGGLTIALKYKNSVKNFGEIDSILKYGSFVLNFQKIMLKKDTFEFSFENGDLNIKNGEITGNAFLYFDGAASQLTLSGNYFKNGIKVTHLTDIDLSKINKEYGGLCNLNGDFIYNVKTKKISGTMDAVIKGFSDKSVNDKINVNIMDIDIKDADSYSIKNITIEGNRIDGSITDVNLVKEKGKFKFSGKGKFVYLDADSLFVNKALTENAAKKVSAPPKVSKNIFGNIEADFDRILFKGEDIRNGKLIIKIENGNIYAYPVQAKLLNGEVDGKVEYYSDANGLVTSVIKSQNLDINDLLLRHKFVPFTVGGKVQTNSNLTFEQHRVKETVKGVIEVSAKKGWLLMPETISKISNVLKLPLPDTFYFDDMYGEFFIDSQRVKFDEFVMEKNGHILNYGGVVDFNKNMKVNGEYIIDMRIADTGLLEKLLRATGYAGDSIIVRFDITGTYSKPKIDIKYNSISENLKEKTNDAVNGMLNQINNLFSPSE